MWPQRLVTCIRSYPGPVILEGGEAYGAPFLIESLAERKLVWLKLSPADASDFVAQGNRLADAVNEALGSTLLPHALPFSYGIEVLRSHLPLLGPLTLALSNADYSPLFGEALLKLNAHGSKVILDMTTLRTPPPPMALHLKPAELALTEAEAGALAGAKLEPDLIKHLWRSAGGAFLTFASGLARLTGQPALTVPAPRTRLAAPGEEALVSPASLLEVLCRTGRYTEALDLAVMSLPERVAGLLKEAGPSYQESGLLSRLHLLLESLEASHQASEEVLSWRLVAAASLGEHEALVPEIKNHLARHEAPELRARYAGTLRDPAQRLAEAERASKVQPDALTLFQYGRLHPDPEQGISLLRESVRLAESRGRPYEVARNAGALGERLIHRGQFGEAATWTEWALRFFDQHALKDGQRRLRLVNNWAFARILLGQTVGLRDELKRTQAHLEGVLPELAVLFRSTLADLELVLGNLAEAERLAGENVTEGSRLQRGHYAAALVRVLLERGELRAALAEGERAVNLTASEADSYHLPAQLALGMALAFHEPGRARAPLQQVMHASELSMHQRLMAALHLLLADLLRTERGAAAREGQGLTLATLPDELRACLSCLAPSGLKLLSGPEASFRSIWAQVLQQEAALELRVLGEPQVWFHGERLELSEQALEILVLLAFAPGGLSPEKLHSQLYHDEEVKLVSLRSAVSRLRQHLPVSTQPYTLTVACRCDALDCQAHLAAGRVREALELYRGPLLPKSDAPGIRSAREHLEEHLRQAALLSADPEVLLALAGNLADDAELWLAAKEALGSGDPRLPLVRAHLERLLRELA